MLKSVMVLVSKRRGRDLARKNYPYLNRWSDPLFIDVPRGLECSGNPIGLNSECSQRVDMFQAYRHLLCQSGQTTGAGDMTSVVASGVKCQVTDAGCRVDVLSSA
ncbi:hypothetical protein TIFTF001_014446 [Ficus carica]|uniref:Uncharacterized protein n=1 Tax=Ficus carica TaxID=3494 RepID=A0AA88D5L6_FICCA|nr:hypothetical protein TIFTF001_014446 [Ficus carica]